MLARFQVLFTLLALFSSAFATYSNSTFVTLPTVSVTAPISTGTGSGVTTVNGTILVTPTPTASSTSTPTPISANGAGSSAGYLNAAVVGVVALGAAFVSL